MPDTVVSTESGEKPTQRLRAAISYISEEFGDPYKLGLRPDFARELAAEMGVVPEFFDSFPVVVAAEGDFVPGTKGIMVYYAPREEGAL